MSVKLALEQLGFGPCHHMYEVMENPAQLSRWRAIAAGERVEWNAVFEGYGAQVDWPGAAVWRETSIAFPDAKVVHTERPEDNWWNSFNTTIGKFFAALPVLDLPPHVRAVAELMSGWWLSDTFDDYTDRDSAIAAYRGNNRSVRETIPADRLLVFNVADGWEPLCRFLDVPIPDTPFPRANPRDEFWTHFGGEPP